MILDPIPAPAVEPILLDEALGWTSIETTDITGTVSAPARQLLTECIAEQRHIVEARIGRATIVRTFVARFDRRDLFRADGSAVPVLFLPIRPLVAVASIKATDSLGVETTVDPSIYWALAGEGARVALRAGAAWPTDLRREACLAVTFTAGQATAVGPVTGTTGDTLAAVAGALADARTAGAVRFGVEVAGEAIVWQLFGAESDDFDDEVAVTVERTVAAGRTDHVGIPRTSSSYYRIKARSAAEDKPGTITVSGIVGTIDGVVRLGIRELVHYSMTYRGDLLFVGAGGFKAQAPPPDAIFRKLDEVFGVPGFA